MTYEEFNRFCQELKGATYVMQWGDSHVWKVGGKVFAIGGWSDKSKPAYTFKTSEQNYLFLSEEQGYRPAPYFATRGMKWIQQHDGEPEQDEELAYYLFESYKLVVAKLTKRKRQELGLDLSDFQ